MIVEPVKIVLHGFLGKKFGRFHRYYVNSPRDAFRALCVTVPGFERAFCSFPHQYVFVADDEQILKPEKQGAMPLKKAMHIVPMCVGSGKVFKIIAGVVIAVVGAIFQQYWAVSLGIGLALGGVSEFLMKSPTLTTPQKQDAEKVESYYFRGPQNNTSQGLPVPLIYGDVFCGSVVVSSGIRTYQMQDNPSPPATAVRATAPVTDATLLPIDPKGDPGGNWRGFMTSGGLMGYGWEG